jgi:hypothetical protein
MSVTPPSGLQEVYLMMTWSVAAPAISAAFFSSLVEAVEALTIVLAVGTVRGWRPAGLGALVGLVLLALIVLALGPLLDRCSATPSAACDRRLALAIRHALAAKGDLTRRRRYSPP